MRNFVIFIFVCLATAITYSMVNYYTSFLPMQERIRIEVAQDEKDQIMARYKQCAEDADNTYVTAGTYWCYGADWKPIPGCTLSKADENQFLHEREISKDRCLVEMKAGIHF